MLIFNAMPKLSIISVIFMVFLTRINGDCCYQKGFVYHECANVPHETQTTKILEETEESACLSYICGDGSTTPRFQYCGHGPCNLFGCFCSGDCRNDDATREEAIKLFKIHYGIEFIEYDCPEHVDNPNNFMCHLDFS